MSAPEIVTGTLSVHPRGFGFLRVERPGEVLSAFVAPPDLNPFLAGDRVQATLVAAPDGRLSALDLTLLSRPRDVVFGEVVQRRGSPWLRIDREVANTDWPLDTRGAEVAIGDAVVARLEGSRLLLDRVVGPAEDRALQQVLARYGLQPAFPPEALAESAAVAQRALEAGARRDLREQPTLTIDAPSTRDIDDAIAVLPAQSDGALRLLVSIADVSASLPEGSALDRAARQRATSVYLAGRVVPMLPEELSNGALSLLPGHDRAALTAELRLDAEGGVTAVDVYESLIRSHARLDYDEVADYLDHDRLSPAMEPVRSMMPWLRTVSARLGVARSRRGGLELARDEARITFDAQGAPAGVTAERPNSAHLLIERCMVAANEAIAAWLIDRGVPALFRVHDEPLPERVTDLVQAARHFGFEPGFAPRLTPLALSAFDLQVSGAPSAPALRAVLLRSIGAARYTVAPSPHFGLAAPRYLHFTSPIRRYADLSVHRTIKQYLHGRRDFVPGDPDVERLGGHINARAAGAGRAENDYRRVLVARLMAAHLGEVHTARITSVRPFGLVAQLDATLVEGTLPIDSLPDGPYRPDARETALAGPTRRFAIGMAVRVRIAAADPLLGRIELALVD